MGHRITVPLKEKKPRVTSAPKRGGQIVNVMSAEEFISRINPKKAFAFNARLPSTKSKAYQEMLKTLREEPQAFFYRNAGVFIANEEYLLDGGHTYLALKNAKELEDISISEVQLKVTEESGLTNEEMVDRAKGYNTRVSPPLRGIRDLEGEFADLEGHLGSYGPQFEFRPGTNPNAAYKVDFLIALLNALEGKLKLWRSYASKGVLVRLYTKDKYGLIIEHLVIAIELWSQIYKDLLKNPKVIKWQGVSKDRTVILPTGETVKGSIPEGYMWPIFSAFSKLLDEGGSWKMNPLKAWKVGQEKLINIVSRAHTEYARNPNAIGKAEPVYLKAAVALLSVLDVRD